MHVFRYEFRRSLFFVAIWTAAILALAGVFIAFYPIIRDDLNTFSEFINRYPEPVRKAMGIYTDTFKTPLGYFSFAYTMILLFVAIMSLHLSTSIVSKEFSERTADFLLTKPISRTRLLTTKLLTVLVDLLSMTVLYSIITGFSIYLLDTEAFDTEIFLLYTFGIILIQMIFGSIGSFLGCAIRRIRSVIPISLGISMFFYALSAFAVTSESDFLRYLTPFEYVKASSFISDHQPEWIFIAIGSVIIVGSIFASYIFYTRREVQSV